MMVDTCATCKYSFKNSDVSWSCRRYPPTVLVEEHVNMDHLGNRSSWDIITSRYVEINANDWCGEYVLRFPASN